MTSIYKAKDITNKLRLDGIGKEGTPMFFLYMRDRQSWLVNLTLILFLNAIYQTYIDT